MDLKPNKEKLNIAVFFLAAIYLCSGASDYLTQFSNVAVEEYIFTLGGDIETHGRELDRLYAQVYTDTLSLPKEQQSHIRYIRLKHAAVKCLLASLFAFYSACVVLYRLRKQEPKIGNT